MNVGEMVDLSRTPMQYGETSEDSTTNRTPKQQQPFGGRCTDPENGCGCPPGFFPYFNPYGVNQCVGTVHLLLSFQQNWYSEIDESRKT